MLDMVLNVIREQSVFVLMGLLVVGGLFAQLMASRRYRKLRSGIQSLAALQNSSPSTASTLRTQSIQLARSERAERRRQAQLEREQEAGLTDGASQSDQPSIEASAGMSIEKEPSAADKAKSTADKQKAVADESGSPADKPAAEGAETDEVDSQLLYLRQSLDRIAAGRDQKLEEEPRRRRKLTPAEEQVIVDILREYLS